MRKRRSAGCRSSRARRPWPDEANDGWTSQRRSFRERVERLIEAAGGERQGEIPAGRIPEQDPPRLARLAPLLQHVIAGRGLGEAACRQAAPPRQFDQLGILLAHDDLDAAREGDTDRHDGGYAHRLAIREAPEHDLGDRSLLALGLQHLRDLADPDGLAGIGDALSAQGPVAEARGRAAGFGWDDWCGRRRRGGRLRRGGLGRGGPDQRRHAGTEQRPGENRSACLHVPPPQVPPRALTPCRQQEQHLAVRWSGALRQQGEIRVQVHIEATARPMNG